MIPSTKLAVVKLLKDKTVLAMFAVKATFAIPEVFAKFGTLDPDAGSTQILLPLISDESTYPETAGRPKSGSVSDNPINWYRSALTLALVTFAILPEISLVIC